MEALQRLECFITELKQKLKECQEAAVSLSDFLVTENRKKEIWVKLDALWETHETITEYLKDISEILTNCEQHRVNLSTLYDNVILKQREDIQKLQSNNLKSKDLEDQVTHLKSRLQASEKKNYDIAQSAARLENKLLLQKKKIQNFLTEQNKWQKQIKNTKREFHLRISKLASAHVEEKKKLVEEQQQLITKNENLQSQINILEQASTNSTEIIIQKDKLLSKFQDENFTYINQVGKINARYYELLTKYEALLEKQNILKRELRTETEKQEAQVPSAKRKRFN